MTTPEQALWQIVLTQAVNDALIGVTSNGEGGTRQSKIRNTHAARAYFTKPDKDLAMICTLAGLDATAVREAMIKRISEAPAPEDLFTGSRRLNPSAASQITYEGTTRTLHAWAAITGISETSLRNRISSGWTVARALTTPVGRPAAQPKPQRTSTAKTLTYKSQTRTIAQWSKITGISKIILHMRERSGWDAERIITTPYAPRGTNVKRITHEGLSLTIAEWSERIGVSVSTIQQRRRNGLPIDRVLSAEVRMGRPRGVVLNLTTYAGTGGRTAAQPRSNIDVSEETTQ